MGVGPDLTSSPFYEAFGENAAETQQTLTELAGSLPEVDAAAAALRAGQLTPQQRDGLLADMLDLYRKILQLVLGRPS